MDTARQVVRWSIPGAVFILALLIYEAITAMIVGSPTHYISSRISGIDLTPVVALSIFASIAFGYLIYQFYFVLYGMVSVPIINLARADRGLAILWHLARGEDLVQDSTPPADATASLQKQIGDLTGAVTDMEQFVVPRGSWPKYLQLKARDKDNKKVTRGRAKDAQRVNWSATKSLLNLVTAECESSHVHKEYTTLSDIYHSLGASVVATFLALLVYGAANVGFYSSRWDEPLPQEALAVLLVLGTVSVLVSVFIVNRRNAFDDSQKTLMFGLRFHVLKLGLITVDRDIHVPALKAAGSSNAP